MQASQASIPWRILHGLLYHSAVFIVCACHSFTRAWSFYVSNPKGSLLVNDGSASLRSHGTHGRLSDKENSFYEVYWPGQNSFYEVSWPERNSFYVVTQPGWNCAKLLIKLQSPLSRPSQLTKTVMSRQDTFKKMFRRKY